MGRRSRVRLRRLLFHGARWAVMLGAAAGLALWIAWPLANAWLAGAGLAGAGGPGGPLPAALEQTRDRAVSALAQVWIFFFGACWGSFLNVVAARLPRGASIVSAPSACPRCGARIRPWHNVPVFGWLWLGGRCAACRLPISPRYVVVEVTAGLMFLGLAHLELFSGGANLPGPPRAAAVGVEAALLTPSPTLLAICAYHAYLLAALLCAALIAGDGLPPPRGFWPTLLALAAAAPPWWSLLALWLEPRVAPDALQLAPRQALPAWPSDAVWWWTAGALATSLAGMAVGACCGALLAWTRADANATSDAGPGVEDADAARRDEAAQRADAARRDEAARRTLAPASALVGAVLGWQAAACVALAALLACLATAPLAWRGRRRPPLAAWLWLAALGLLCAWRGLDAAGQRCAAAARALAPAAPGGLK